MSKVWKKDIKASKLNVGDISNLEKNLNAKLVSNQYTLFDSSRFSHSDCGSWAVKTYANNRILLEWK